MLTNRGGVKREFVSNIDYSHRPAKGKRYLKTVQSNPYRFVGMSAENIFRLKEFLNVRLIAKNQALEIPGVELKPDRFENGIPYLEKSHQPLALIVEINNYNVNKDVLANLIDIVETEEVEETDEFMDELAKIISSGNSEANSTDDFLEDIEEEVEEEVENEEDEDLDDNLVQQTLF
jgi:hypothetical protein